jgi:hypothetical protein
LIDASVVQKKSAWDIANENISHSFTSFFWKVSVFSHLVRLLQQVNDMKALLHFVECTYFEDAGLSP